MPNEHQEPMDSKESNSPNHFLNYHRGSTDSKDNNLSRFPIYHRDSTDSIPNNANMYHSMYQEEMREREEAMKRVQVRVLMVLY